jgi:hypothetical protein
MTATNTDRYFNELLNEYLPNDMLMEELIKRDYVLNRVAKDEDWRGGDVIVPFRAAQASSVRWGGLTASGNIARSRYIRGKIDEYKEIWGSLVFDSTDLMQHQGAKITEESFLKILPDELEHFMDYMKEVVSISLTAGPHFATVTDGTNAATGKFIVDRIDRFLIDQECVVDDGNSPVLTVYVTNIILDTDEVTFSATRGGGAVDLSAYTVAQAAKFYHPGAWDGTNDSTFISIRSALLSAANGGSTSLHTKTKTSYPHLQALNLSGSDMNRSNILEKLFTKYVAVRQKTRGKANRVCHVADQLGRMYAVAANRKRRVPRRRRSEQERVRLVGNHDRLDLERRSAQNRGHP